MNDPTHRCRGLQRAISSQLSALRKNLLRADSFDRMKVLNSEQMRNIDRRAIDRFGVPSIVLMENAALAVVDALAAHYPNADRVAIFCGTGSNGGDGFAVARHLENRGVVPIVLIAGERDRIEGDARTNLTICERLAVPIY